MNLLLVDDDAHVMESIEKRLDWESLRIQERYTALNAAKARQILLEYSVDIVLCDIEMPQENGLELLGWIREHRLDVQALLLTSYADFQYAQRALSLGCLDYFLKPVDYEKLGVGLKRAVARVRDSRKYELYEKKNGLKDQRAGSTQDYFWGRMLSGAVQPVREEIEKEIHMQQLPYTADDSVAVCMLKIVSESSSRTDNEMSVEDRNEKWKNYLEEAYAKWDLSGAFTLESTVFWGRKLWILIIGRKERPDRVNSGLGESLVRACWEMGHVNAVCGIGDWCVLEDFYSQVKELQELLRKMGGVSSRVFCQWDIERKVIAYRAPQLELWEAMLSKGDKTDLKAQVRDYLRRQEMETGVNRQTLKQFRLDVTQMVYTFLRQNQIQAHMIFHNSENDNLYGQAVNSSGAMLAYADYLLDQAFAYKSLSEEPHNAIRRLMKHIDSHFQDELSREELAAMVYLNPDYLSRRFKEETGVSISGYIMDCRIEKARELLKNTMMPINAVALEVGYDNFAYFAKVFRNKTEVSPNEYRKRWKQRGD